MMWTAFPCWLISMIMFCVVIRYGAMFLIGTGIFQLIAVTIWYSVRNFVELQVPYEYHEKEVILKTHFGSDFYLVLINGGMCVLLGFGIFVANAVFPDEMCQFFGIDPLTLYDEYHLSKIEQNDVILCSINPYTGSGPLSLSFWLDAVEFYFFRARLKKQTWRVGQGTLPTDVRPHCRPDCYYFFLV